MDKSMFSSASELQYTPKDIIERARYVFGGTIDLDPASDFAAQRVVNATRYYTEIDNGLIQDWTSTSLWLNPPFSIDKQDNLGKVILSEHTGKPIRKRVIQFWVHRWHAANLNHETEQAMLLVPARTDTNWFSPVWNYALCFISGRLKFSDAQNSAPFPSVIAYAGPNIDRFYDIFAPIGTCGRFNIVQGEYAWD